MGLTDRLYYSDSYLTQFSAEIIEVTDDGRRVYLDRTAFYPTSGGQLFDQGTLGGQQVTDVVDEEGRIAHLVDQPLSLGPIQGEVNWKRRFDHMQQHSGQHLLSAVFAEHFGLETVSVHLGESTSTIDVAVPSIAPDILIEAERQANEAVFQNLPLSVSFEDAATAEGLRKESARTGMLRIVTIQNLDRSACGGTHVRATGEIGPIFLRKTEKIRNSTRIEFVCGLRAVQAARSDFSALKEQAAIYQARLAEGDKERKKLIAEVASFRGKELYQTAAVEANGIRSVVQQLPEISDATRRESQAFTQGGRSVYIAMAGSSILLATSADSGIHAGATIKEIATQGGGSATTAQGSVNDPESALRTIQDKIRAV